ncbi:MAG: type I DNA topoisomerase [Deltaproteobacteria bacterium]|nr:type I DNA topoisomerase [Deltaproteobacteria bacterium]
MGKSLVIVESPAKAKTINKYLGKGFTVMASVGHIKDLPKSKLGVDIENDFAPQYETIKGKATIISDLKKAGKEADAIYIGPDPDREGEAIAWHIREALDGKGKAKKPVYRVLFNEITEKAIKEAIKNPGDIDMKKVDAQQARRILDRLVGYQVSPILWDKVRRGLSAGRVQSVAVRLICEREREIQAFKAIEYWSITAEFDKFVAKLVKKDSKPITISTEAEATAVLTDLKGAKFAVADIEKKERKKNPLAPFITSRMQQEAARKLGYTAKKTMMLAQQLYEGIELGEEGPVGLITYMRTDSPRVSSEAIAAVREHIQAKYGKDFLPEKPNEYKGKKSAQDAHEAIRPTSLNYTPEKVKTFLSRDQQRLYDLIWKRFVASQMTPAVLDQTKAEITAKNYLFQANGVTVKFAGFTAVYEEGKDDVAEGEGDEDEKKLPPLKAGQELAANAVTPKQHFTQPPPRFTEATLVKELEEKGIGRPSTYASIISTIVDREYVAKDQKRLSPTELGFTITDLLVESFPKILNVEFTALMENELDQVEDGAIEWLRVMRDFYEPFKESLDKAKEGMKNLKAEETPTDLKCPKCGNSMVIKWGRRGKFLACSGYPECKSTSDFRVDEDGKVHPVERKDTTDEKCPKCGNPMAVKSGRFGKFLACTAYPECKSTMPYSTGVPCPEEGCTGKVIERRTKKGRVFYGCSRYPDCKYASWVEPKKE